MKTVIFIQPFLFKDQQMTDEILIWPIYLENFLKSRVKNLKSHLLYFPVELLKNDLKIEGVKDQEKLNSLISSLLSKIDFEINKSTLLCISCPTSHHYLPTLMLVHYLNKFLSKSIIIIGGTHVSACPNDFFLKRSHVDYIIKGEGENSLYELLIQGPKKRKKPQIIENHPVLDLNQLPLIDFSIFDDYISHFKGLCISLSRGCPFHCTFCMEQTLRENLKVKLWRSYSPKRAVQEVNKMVSYGHENGIHEFGFYDPIFGLQKKWLEKFISYFNTEIERGWIETRIDILNETLLRQLKQKNFLMWYGVESFSLELLKIMKKAMDPRKFLDTFNKIYRYHVNNNHGFNMNILCGHPGETLESYNTTFNRLGEMIANQEIKLSQLSIRYYHNFPGTHIYRNIESFNRLYGTEMYFPEWWKKEELLEFGSLCIKPSKALTIQESYDLFTEKYKELLSLAKNGIKEKKTVYRLPLLFNIKNQIEILEEKRENFFRFLDNHGFNDFEKFARFKNKFQQKKVREIF